MTVVIRFTTSMFSVEAERTNPINPIPGESLLRWLQEEFRPDLRLTDPEPEDWGWYSNTELNGSRYMLGSSASEQENGQREWVLQVVKNRSLKDKLLSRGKTTAEDPLVIKLQQALWSEPEFHSVQVESTA